MAGETNVECHKTCMTCECRPVTVTDLPPCSVGPHTFQLWRRRQAGAVGCWASLKELRRNTVCQHVRALGTVRGPVPSPLCRHLLETGFVVMLKAACWDDLILNRRKKVLMNP